MSFIGSGLDRKCVSHIFYRNLAHRLPIDQFDATNSPLYPLEVVVDKAGRSVILLDDHRNQTVRGNFKVGRWTVRNPINLRFTFISMTDVAVGEGRNR